MRKLYILPFLLLFSSLAFAQETSTNLYSIPVTGIDGKPIELSDYKGKNILIVNVASNCDFALQYTELEKLYKEYKEDLVVIAFPSNEFGKQEPGTNEEIKTFCDGNFNITFPIAQKTTVKGKEKHPLYKWLTNSKLNGWNNSKPKWNFYKYLVNKKGQLVNSYSSKTKPYSKKITKFLKN